MTNEEFSVNSMPNAVLRFTYMSPIDITVFSANFNLQDFKTTKEMFKYAAEHTEIKINDAWCKVKVPEKEVYMPATISAQTLLEIADKFVEKYIMPVFQKSSE